MPAIITHHLFGEDAATRLPEGTIDGQEELLAFLLGNQGPDPLWARTLAKRTEVDACHRLATAMHGEHIVEALMRFRSAVSHLPEYDKRVGRAFALGLLAHYVLDRSTHPFVFAQQQALCEADPTLKESLDNVHAIIESDLDSWMLWSQRGLTVADAPTTANLAHTDRVVRVAGALFSQVAWQVFGIAMGADAYEGSINDYQFVYALIDPAPSLRTSLIARLKGVTDEAEHLLSLAHRIVTDDDCPAANLDCHPWTNPSTGEVRDVSFGDLYFEALDAWPSFAEAYTEGDETKLADLIADVNYEGVPLS